MLYDTLRHGSSSEASAHKTTRSRPAARLVNERRARVDAEDAGDVGKLRERATQRPGAAADIGHLHVRTRAAEGLCECVPAQHLLLRLGRALLEHAGELDVRGAALAPADLRLRHLAVGVGGGEHEDVRMARCDDCGGDGCQAGSAADFTALSRPFPAT
eukprot:1149036-Prymnesium_polylepis.2